MNKELVEKMREAVENSYDRVPNTGIRLLNPTKVAEQCAAVASEHYGDKADMVIEDEPITDELLKAMGFKYRWPEYLNHPEYRRGDDHPDGGAYIVHPCSYIGVMMYGDDKILQTKQDVINYLSNPDRHKG